MTVDKSGIFVILKLVGEVRIVFEQSFRIISSEFQVTGNVIDI